MSWSCPNQIEDCFCELRNKKCKPGAEGCVIPRKYIMKKGEINLEVDKNTEKE